MEAGTNAGYFAQDVPGKKMCPCCLCVLHLRMVAKEDKRSPLTTVKTLP